jgi:DnaJ-class molecular chaperone
MFPTRNFHGYDPSSMHMMTQGCILQQDVVIVIKQKKHPVFRREKNNVYVQCELSRHAVMMGCNATVPTLVSPKCHNASTCGP